MCFACLDMLHSGPTTTDECFKRTTQKSSAPKQNHCSNIVISSFSLKPIFDCLCHSFKLEESKCWCQTKPLFKYCDISQLHKQLFIETKPYLTCIIVCANINVKLK